MTPITRIKSQLYDLLTNDSGIIAASRIAPYNWVDHVFDGIIRDGFIGPRNRGRLPYVEYELEEYNATNVSKDAAYVTLPATFRVRAGGGIGTAPSTQIEFIVKQIEDAIRTWSFDTSQGYEAGVPGDKLFADSQFSAGPMKWDKASAYQDLSAALEYHVDRSTVGA